MADAAGQRTGRPLRTLVCFSALAIIHRGAGLLMLPIYVGHIPPREYGVLAAVIVIAAILSVPSNLKLDAAMRTFYFDYCDRGKEIESYLRQVFSAAVYSAATVYAVMLVVGEAAFDIIFAHAEVQFLPAGAIALATASMSACLSPYFVFLRNSLRLRELVYWQTLIVAGTVVLQCVLVVGFDRGLYGVLWGALAPVALTAALLGLSGPRLLTVRLDRRYLLPSLKYSVPLVGLGLVYSVGTRIDRLVLERYVDLDVLGAYAVLAGVLGVLTITLDTLDNMIRPYLYPGMRSRDAPAEEVLGAFRRLYLLSGLLALSVAVFLGSSLQLVTDNPAYLSIRQWLPLGATAFVPVIFARWYTLFFDFHKRSTDLMAATLARLGVFLALLIALVPKAGVKGALCAIFLAELTSALVLGSTARRLFSAQVSWRANAEPVAIFTGTLWLLWYSVGTDSSAIFGALQFALSAVLLLTGNREALRATLGVTRAASIAISHRRDS